MKLFSALLLLITSTNAWSQTLPSKVFYWNEAAVQSTANGTTRTIFSGAGAILAKHQVTGISIHPGKTISYPSNVNGDELFFIVKKGPVTVHLNNQHTQLDRGSVVLVLPGDEARIENNSDQEAEVYEMRYRSIASPHAARGKKAGASFVMNWKDMVFKPHDKGGVRQLFDRQTVMFNRFDIHVTQLNQGLKSHDPHTHKNEEIILMLEGNAEMQIGTDHQKANPADVVLLGSNVLHNLSNIGQTPCLYFAIQWN
ncbi:MAG TPA: cupin domain-containing protein [Sediminibacterium sp.]